ncbi:histidine kinase-like ATPase [Lipomyces oligophaga]|uniref:histidine kinase-like ATPase n=1 Tax=Lipomyces oligophaga TaxID=45792 RepID=UPI0034CD84F2
MGEIRIKALDSTVVNRIAAGEIIIQPANALKEMLENSIDAGSTSIDVVVKEGGMKMLQVTDNGQGIPNGDLEILCERFTTSKLCKFEDLQTISTYGFRGEALASISHIAHLTVTTRNRTTSDCAWRAVYEDGRLSRPVRPAAGKPGTQILVEDMFYNVPARRRALRSGAEEYTRVLDVVGAYGIHCSGIGFSCKKYGDAHPTLNIPAQASTVDRIRIVYGSPIANELIKVNVPEVAKYGLRGVEGLVTNANYSAKRSYPSVIFINHRAVSCEPLKKAVAQLYSTYLPKGGHAFVYLSLEIAPDKLDVNVHPTKREVRFLHQDEIVQVICEKILDALIAVDSSRSFKTQTVLLAQPTAAEKVVTADKGVEPKAIGSRSGEQSTTNRNNNKKYEYNLVRTDHREQKITTLVPTLATPITPNPPVKRKSNAMDEQSKTSATNLHPSSTGYEFVDREYIGIRLLSVQALRREIRDNLHEGLTDLFANHSFIGVADVYKRLAAIQYGVKLYLVDYGAVCFNLFYQIGVSDFGNFGVIKLQPSVSLLSLIEIDSVESEGDHADIQYKLEQLQSMKSMLLEYFSLEIDDGELKAIPLLLKGYIPPLAKLASFISRLLETDWTEEKSCFRYILRQLASFYVPESLQDNEDVHDKVCGQERQAKVKQTLEQVLFPTIARRLVATESLLPAVIEIANLPNLYHIFERC